MRTFAVLIPEQRIRVEVDDAGYDEKVCALLADDIARGLSVTHSVASERFGPVVLARRVTVAVESCLEDET